MNPPCVFTVFVQLIRVIGPDLGIPQLLVTNEAVTVENQANWEDIIGFNRERGDRVYIISLSGGGEGFRYELAHFESMGQVVFAERNLMLTSFDHPPTPTTVTRS